MCVKYSMRLREILVEYPVSSSWLRDIEYDFNNRDTIMVTSTGRRYRVKKVPWKVFSGWSWSNSKGKYFHRVIRGKFNVEHDN